ncbi:MAG: hypothetical protein DRR19_32095 [Candidatus Parabeggiatoa sp. nov. 1]|nr:MAG: hypothetical protein DRR19_32095 [Gammaproteobacteria bacterium]
MPTLSNLRLGLTYVPASDSDGRALENFIDADNVSTLPVYLFNLKPVLNLEDTALATGTAISMGQSQYLTVIINDPVRGGLVQQSVVTAGDEVVFGVNSSGVPRELVENRLEAIDPHTSAAENLHQTALHFWMAHDFFDELTAQALNVRRVRLPSVGLFTSPLSVSYFFGIARNGIFKARVIDVKQNLQAVGAPTSEILAQFMRQIGIQGSYLENSVIEQLFDYEQGRGISTAQLLMDANEQAIPIYTVTADNIGTVLPLLSVSAEVKTDIKNAIHAGQYAIVPQREIAHGNWRGAGYIIQDPITGAGAYLIEGGLNGGWLACLGCEFSKEALILALMMTILLALLIYAFWPVIMRLGAVAIRSLAVMARTLVRAYFKKQGTKKAKGKKPKKRKDCKPMLKLVSVSFRDDIDIYKDTDKGAQKIPDIVWEKTIFGLKTEPGVAYVSGEPMKITATFKRKQKPSQPVKDITIIGQVTSGSLGKFQTTFEYKKGIFPPSHFTKPFDVRMSAAHAFPKRQTQFYDPLKISWKMTYKWNGKKTTQGIGTSKHKVYVTFDQPHDALGNLYLSPLHWAVSNDGATNKKEVVRNTWRMFAKKSLLGKSGPADIKSWDGKRKFYYYKMGGLPSNERPENCLISPIDYAACGDFADLLLDTLMVNNVVTGSKTIYVKPIEDKKMLIKEWSPIPSTPTVAPNAEGYKWKFFIYNRLDGEGSMISPTGAGAPNNEYDELLNKTGIRGQNTPTPAEKVFGTHTIVKLPKRSLPKELDDTPYFDPSYGVTYRDEKDFEDQAVYGYAKELTRDNQIIEYQVREKPVPNLPHNIQFEVEMQW